jgi:hypothetical protein
VHIKILKYNETVNYIYIFRSMYKSKVIKSYIKELDILNKTASLHIKKIIVLSHTVNYVIIIRH